MLNRLPDWPGEFGDLLAELGITVRQQPALARALGVSERTLWRWKKSGAPRIALLSLWWLSRAGHSAWDAEMFNRSRLAIDLADALRRENDLLRQQLQVLARLGHFGAANEPLMAAELWTGVERHPPGESVPAERRAMPAHVASNEQQHAEHNQCGQHEQQPAR